jgi:hypothetical protein
MSNIHPSILYTKASKDLEAEVEEELKKDEPEETKATAALQKNEVA